MRVLLLLFACGNTTLGISQDLAPPPGADLAGADLARASTDLASPPSSVNCGTMSCAAPDSVCCRSSPFGAGTCIAPGASCMYGSWTCDNPADCGGGNICCDTGSGSICTSDADCTAMNGRRMCVDSTDCAGNLQCCGQGPSPNFYCGNVCPISRRKYKEDIQYLDEPSLQALHDQLLGMRLSTWRYRNDPVSQHLGFIIDDVGAGPAVAPDGEHVDLYGYISMAVATLQVQAQEIAALRAEVKALKSRRK
jgi:hypothetical protein